MSTLENQVIVISGASGALGSLACQYLAGLGAKVYGIYRSRKPTFESDTKIQLYQADLSKPEDAERVVEEIHQLAGRIDGVFHTAGAFEGLGPLHEQSSEVFARMLATNFQTAVHFLRPCLRIMHEQGYGRIVVVSSTATEKWIAGISPYACSKAALNMLVRVASEDYRKWDIKINALLSGLIDTPANRKAMPDVDPSSMVKREELLAAAAFLLSKDCKVTGGLIPIPDRLG